MVNSAALCVQEFVKSVDLTLGVLTTIKVNKQIEEGICQPYEPVCKGVSAVVARGNLTYLRVNLR